MQISSNQVKQVSFLFYAYIVYISDRAPLSYMFTFTNSSLNAFENLFILKVFYVALFSVILFKTYFVLSFISVLKYQFVNCIPVRGIFTVWYLSIYSKHSALLLCKCILAILKSNYFKYILTCTCSIAKFTTFSKVT